MQQSWANYGIDLHLELAGARGARGSRRSRGARGSRRSRGARGSRESRSPRVRAGLEAALRDAVRTGRLGPGVRLPSSRDLAADLGIARNTVADAYSQLVAEGWLEARTGSGTWVTARPAPAPQPPARPTRGSADPRYDLRAGVPAVSAFPRRAWLAAARTALGSANDIALGYPDPRGLPELRAALAGYLGRARGVIASPENVIVCAGFAHGLTLICEVLAERGGTALAMEACGHLLHRRIAAAQGMRPCPLPVDASGAVPGALESPGDLAAVSAVVLTPAHQYPLGMTLAPARRTAFVRWAARTGRVIIEDDYDGEYRFDRQPVGAMQALAPEHVVYAGTASKSLAPGLRLGWLVVPATMTDEVVAAKETSGGVNGTLDQLTLAAFIESGGYDRQIRQSRLAYRRRRDRLIAALRRAAPSVQLTGIAAGLHALAELPGHESEADAIARAARHGVAVDGLAAYTAAGYEHGPALVIGYGRPAEHAFTTAVGRLCAALAESE
jgi:GntR family transcriptional regulator/MocR family aminotransferase